MKVSMTITLLTICAGLCAACDGGDPPACAPYGSIAPTVPSGLADPPLGASPSPAMTLTPSPSPVMTLTLLPTCTPAHPTNTPRPHAGIRPPTY